MREQRARLRRLSVWFSINLIIFVACYLNYRLQLKHRYLYRTLNVGLCFSRAAAMIINFNLLLVWLPMCKYSLTRLAFHANNLLNRLKREQQERQKKNLNEVMISQSSPVLIELPIAKQAHQFNLNHGLYSPTKPTRFSCFRRKFKQSLAEASNQFKSWICEAKLNFINSFLIAVDHCTPLHTICATTITIASVIHTVAHLMNVINFSKNFDPLLSNLNMAEYKGQNPFQLLLSEFHRACPGDFVLSGKVTRISINQMIDPINCSLKFHTVPGITGCLMVIILILMSLSSTDMIRNSSYDLFQIFHRLSILFVFLLFLHPSSHVLKEQSNVDRHHPELCNVSEMTSPSWLLSASQQASSRPLSALGSGGSARHNRTGSHQGRPNESSATSPSFSGSSATHRHHYDDFVNNNNNNKTDLNNHDISATIVGLGRSTSPLELASNKSGAKIDRLESMGGYNISRSEPRPFNLNEPPMANRSAGLLCLDPVPLFVAQSSICWYVLSIGLSCYLFDLILRKWRRSKSSIQLLDVRLDAEGNLIELILSNNHKRFSQWLPGQFVYLNCPQLATNEWHPFTISSMDNRSRQFTLHIKTGGDWTRKLREKLKSRQLESNINSSMSSMNSTCCYSILPNLDCYNRMGQLQVECTKVVQIELNNANYNADYSPSVEQQEYFCCDQNNKNGSRDLLDRRLHSVICRPPDQSRGPTRERESVKLNLYIDGPFHSPFERLLEQQVSVCIANGVGWTAFSSTFQCITNNYSYQTRKDEAAKSQAWWWKWRNFAVSNPTDGPQQQQQARMIRKLSDTKLHIMVIVTSIEQLRPFYELAQNYFNRIQDECQLSGAADPLNPVREITAFITRSTKEDDSVRKFCEQEKLFLFNSNQHQHNQMIRVNEVFTIEFGKPQFDRFLSAFNAIYPDRQKVSVYCCGSYHVKKTVKDICQHLNKASKSSDRRRWPVYSYHEENF